MTTIRPNAEPAATTVAAGDIFLIDGATGVRALSASVVPIRDANGNVTVNNLLEGFASTVTAAGTTTLTATSAGQQFFTGTTTQTIVLPVVSTLIKGQSWFFQNGSTGAITVNSSGGNAVKVIGPGTSAIITCVAITGTDQTSWQPIYFDDIAASGKVLTVSNSLTLAGTDGKTLTLTNGLTVSGNDGTLSFGAASKTLTTNNSLTLAGTDGSTLNAGVGGTLTGSSNAAVFYDNIPQNSKSAAYTTVLSDAQKHIFHPTADVTARTWTIDSNANVPYPIGTAITFINQHGAGVITIAITSDTLWLAGTNTSGSRSLAAAGIATAIKVTSTEWIISGTGLT